MGCTVAFVFLLSDLDQALIIMHFTSVPSVRLGSSENGFKITFKERKVTYMTIWIRYMLIFATIAKTKCSKTQRYKSSTLAYSIANYFKHKNSYMHDC